MELSESETVVFCSLEESPAEWQVHAELPDQSAIDTHNPCLSVRQKPLHFCYDYYYY